MIEILVSLSWLTSKMVAVNIVNLKASSEFKETDNKLCFGCVCVRFLGGNKEQVSSRARCVHEIPEDEDLGVVSTGEMR